MLRILAIGLFYFYLCYFILLFFNFFRMIYVDDLKSLEILEEKNTSTIFFELLAMRYREAHILIVVIFVHLILYVYSCISSNLKIY